MPRKAEVGERRKRKGGTYEKLPSGKWKRVRVKGDQTTTVKKKAPTKKKAVSKKDTSRWAAKKGNPSDFNKLLDKEIGKRKLKSDPKPSKKSDSDLLADMEKSLGIKPPKKPKQPQLAKVSQPQPAKTAKKPEAKKSGTDVASQVTNSKEASKSATAGAALADNAKDFAKISVGKKSEASFRRSEKAEIADKEKRIFGKEVTDDVYRSLAGAPKGANIVIAPSYEGDAIEILATGKGYSAFRSVRKDPKTGKTTLYQESFSLKGHPKGTGSTIFASQVDAAHKNGISKIVVPEAAGVGPKAAPEGYTHRYNGYYTWARLGYTGKATFDDASTSVGKKQREVFGSDSVDVQKLMATPEGRKKWRDYGSSFEGEFDTAPGSYSRRVLEAYLEERKKSK